MCSVLRRTSLEFWYWAEHSATADIGARGYHSRAMAMPVHHVGVRRPQGVQRPPVRSMGVLRNRSLDGIYDGPGLDKARLRRARRLPRWRYGAPRVRLGGCSRGSHTDRFTAHAGRLGG